MKLLRWLGQLLFFLAVAGKMGAQTEHTPPVRFGIVTPEVREYLAREWDLHAHDSPYLERGYCGHIEPGVFAGQAAWMVTSITPPDTVIGTPSTVGINFRCYDAWSIPIHVHPPQSCENALSPCYPEGLYARQCMASDSDRRMLTYWQYPFGVVQCDRKANITFWPVGIAGV